MDINCILIDDVIFFDCKLMINQSWPSAMLLSKYGNDDALTLVSARDFLNSNRLMRQIIH